MPAGRVHDNYFHAKIAIMGEMTEVREPFHDWLRPLPSYLASHASQPSSLHADAT